MGATRRTGRWLVRLLVLRATPKSYGLIAIGRPATDILARRIWFWSSFSLCNRLCMIGCRATLPTNADVSIPPRIMLGGSENFSDTDAEGMIPRCDKVFSSVLTGR